MGGGGKRGTSFPMQSESAQCSEKQQSQCKGEGGLKISKHAGNKTKLCSGPASREQIVNV